MKALRRLNHSSVILTTGFVILFFNGGSRFAFGLVLKPMTEDLGWSRSSLSLAASVFFMVSALAMPLFGRLADRDSLRLVIAGAAAVGAVGIGLMGSVNATWQVFVLYGLVYAIGSAGTSIAPVGVMISAWFTRRRGIANSVAMSGNAVGQLIIITLLASLLAALTWRGAFLVLGIANLAIVVPLVLLTVKSTPSTNPREMPQPSPRVRVAENPMPHTSLKFALNSKQFRLLVVIYAICGFQDFFMATHVVAFAQDNGVGSALAGNMLALMGLLGLIGVLIAGVVSDSWGAVRPTALCFAFRIGIFAYIIYFQSTPSILIFALLYGFTFLITAPLTLVFVANIFGTQRLGTLSGLISMAHQFGGGLGAFVGGYIFDHWGSYDNAFVLMLALAIIGVLFTLMIRERPMARLATA